MDNLPGFPNGISIRENGTYWLGFTTKRSDTLDKIHPKVGMKKFVYGLPSFLQPKAEKFGMVMNVSQGGAILQFFSIQKALSCPKLGLLKNTMATYIMVVMSFHTLANTS